jgi:Trk K+ transport system NAD-binding subunit
MNQPALPETRGQAPYVVVAGFGLPGRTLVDCLVRHCIDYMVIELNGQTCERAAAGGIHMIQGSASDAAMLQRAGVERASIVALMVPNDEVVLTAIPLVRRLNGSAHIIARCSFTSTGMEAIKRGANQSIVAEQVIARELAAITEGLLGSPRK